MKLSKNQILGIIRQLLTMIGAALASYGFENIAGVNWQEIAGVALALIATVWGFIDKTDRDKNALFSVLRHAISITTGIIISISPELGKFLGIVTPSLMGIFAIILTVNENGDGGNK